MSHSLLALVANAGDGSVTAFRVTDDRLQRLAVSEVATGCSTFAVDRDRYLVYAAGKDPARVVSCGLDPASGELEVIGTRPVPASLTYLALTPRGGQLLGASYSGGLACCWPVDGGQVGEPGEPVRYRNLHAVVVTRDSRQAYLVSLGEDLIVRCTVTADHQLVDPVTVAAPAGSGPRHLVLNAHQTAAYVVTEFSGEVLHYHRDLDTGDLSLQEQVSVVDPQAGLRPSRFGADPLAETLVWGADLHLAPHQGWLWATERTASTVATVPLGLGGGLEPASAVAPTEQQPRGFAVSPDGQHLLVAGERSGKVTLHRVGPDGSLERVDQQPSGAGASWVRFL
ncbi:MAG: beta-propeller fold lactonase family protein [Actinomycetia bacterium]|nr:beta-propeller fold lactonase family protein [Actinomycetes bacterium]